MMDVLFGERRCTACVSELLVVPVVLYVYN